MNRERMSASSRKPDEVAVAILKALVELGGGPVSCKEIAAKAGLDVRRVAGKIRGLVNTGYVEKVEEGKYRVTDKGRELVSA
ncbi:MAG: winged helix-turn-helix domain-containing protein [Thermofilum sp.]|uniref:ArnR1-like winged helix-turn-helix domain-containing protein n=1 Tax=Thermofilum pendens TaxID=2269 RepID=A0A7C4D201_THEPE